MKKFDIKIKNLAGIAMALMIGLSATIDAINDRRRTEKIEELIDKVDKLTD